MITVETTDAKEKLVQLIELQVYYNRLYTLLQREGDLPKQIQELEYQVQALRKQISDRKTELRHMENEIAQLHVSNDTLQDHIQKLEKTLLQLRSDEHVFRIETEIKEARLTIEKNRRDIRILSQKVEVLRN
jgi:predicted  nucleic acid-binding Zn-ribbon protein